MGMYFERKIKRIILKSSKESPDYWDGIAQKLNLEAAASEKSRGVHLKYPVLKFSAALVAAILIVCIFGTALFDNMPIKRQAEVKVNNSIAQKVIPKMTLVAYAEATGNAEKGSVSIVNGKEIVLANSRFPLTAAISGGHVDTRGRETFEYIGRWGVKCNGGDISKLILKTDQGIFYEDKELTPEEVKRHERGESTYEIMYSSNENGVKRLCTFRPIGSTEIRDYSQHAPDSKGIFFWWRSTVNVLRDVSNGKVQGFKMDKDVNITVTAIFKDGQEVTQNLVLRSKDGELVATLKE